jgi:hypothetical protein
MPPHAPAQFPKWDRCKNTKKPQQNCCPNTTVLHGYLLAQRYETLLRNSQRYET